MGKWSSMSDIDSMTMSLPAPSKVGGATQPTGSGERSRTMIIIGVDYHPEFQQLASVDTETGGFSEARLQNPEQAEKFYRELAGRDAIDWAFRSPGGSPNQ